MESPSERDTEKRRDDALRRALNTPPKPKSNGNGDKSQSENEDDKEARR